MRLSIVSSPRYRGQVTMKRRLPINFGQNEDLNDIRSLISNGDMAKFAIKANLAGIATCIAFIVAATQAMIPADCQANYNAAQIIGMARSSIALFSVRLLVSAYHMVATAVSAAIMPFGVLLYDTYRLSKLMLRRRIPFHRVELIVRRMLAPLKRRAEEATSRPLTRSSIALDYISMRMGKLNVRGLGFFLGLVGTFSFFWGVYGLTPIAFHALSWDGALSMHRQAFNVCAALGGKAANSTPINPFSK